MKEEEIAFSFKIAEILEELIRKNGLELPFLIAVVGINGSCMFLKYFQAQDGLDSEFIIEHFEGKGLALPINIMIVDAQGEAARVFIEKPDEFQISDFVGHA